MSGMTSRRRRVFASSLATLALAGGVIVAGATPASASPDPGHWCPAEIFPWQDDSVLLDPIHHNVEPLVPALHDYNCALQAALNQYSCYLPGLAGLLRGTQSYPFCP